MRDFDGREFGDGPGAKPLHGGADDQRDSRGDRAVGAGGGERDLCAGASGFIRMRFGFPCYGWRLWGALVNLAVLAWIWHCAARPAAQWRRREIS